MFPSSFLIVFSVLLSAAAATRDDSAHIASKLLAKVSDKPSAIQTFTTLIKPPSQEQKRAIPNLAALTTLQVSYQKPTPILCKGALQPSSAPTPEVAPTFNPDLMRTTTTDYTTPEVTNALADDTSYLGPDVHKGTTNIVTNPYVTITSFTTIVQGGTTMVEEVLWLTKYTPDATPSPSA
ncbi:hypothetical protein K470DRAFT_294825 [Piedraia hortae CBS 480.64]|uniref:Uncharacterized protein n=1 Tax=Piedraia hortae CBS 480.64 TaxID=1314780 RepID=A0A6A7BZT2_9PEZI|nr:hypothetical protein K470DRAFT_294825 [Piedraia hortae CBS 480.64]